MNKFYIAVLLALSLFSCSDSKEVLDLKQALIAKLADDSDLTDYKLDPADIADCIVSQVADKSSTLPGHPHRQQVFEAYAKFVSVKSPGDAQNAVDQYKDLFGGVKESQAAAMEVTEYIMDCMGQAIEKLAPEGQKHIPENDKPREEAAQQKQPAIGQPAVQ
jgi:hypothetical protein